jgi:ABC-2 type transport system permease protein
MTAVAELLTHATAPPRVTRPSLARLTGVELRKTVDTRAGLWLLLVTALIGVGVVVIALTVGESEDQVFAEMFFFALGVTGVLLPVLGILAVTSEWSQRTALTTFTLVPERSRVIAAKAAAGIGLGLVVMVACMLAAGAGNVIAGGSWSFELSELRNAVLIQAINMLIGFALGLLFLNSPLAIVLYFVLPTVWGILGELWDALPADWLDTSRTMEPLFENEMAGGDWGRLATSLALWLLLPLVLGLLRLRRAEVK